MRLNNQDRIRLERNYGIVLMNLENSEGIKTGVYIKAIKDNIIKIGNMKNICVKELMELGEFIAAFHGDEPPKGVKDYVDSLILPAHF